MGENAMSAHGSPRAFPSRVLVPALLALLFLGPFAGAWVLYFTQADEWRAASVAASHGELVVPARPVNDFTLRRLDGTAFEDEHLRAKWTLIYVTGSDCTATCRDVLYHLRQVRLALGKDMTRVQRLLVLTDTDRLDALGDALREHPGVIVANAPDAALGPFLDSFALPGEPPVREAGRVYVVDPLGNFMMSYAAGAEPRGMLKDLERLLKLSRIG
jgi:cytochrome oxidase Cu insertion factor (SCO1/SenC/PrrC family)